MKKDPRLKRQILRVALVIKRQGYRVSLYERDLAQPFDILAESVYSPELDSGIYIRVQINKISEEALQAVLGYSTGKRRKKEIWLVRFRKGSKNDPGHAVVFRCQDVRIIEYPKGLELSEVMSSPGKRGVKSRKTEPKSARIGS